MRQGGKEVALGPTSMFFPNRIPFLIPLGTEEESAEYEEGEYTTDIEDAIPNIHYSNRQQGGGLAPIYRDMNPMPRPVQNQMQVSNQGMGNSGRHSIDGQERQQMDNRERKGMGNREGQGMDKGGRQGVNVMNQDRDQSMSFSANKGQQKSMGHNQLKSSEKARQNMMNNQNKFVTDLEPDFAIEANDSELPKSLQGIKNKKGNQNQNSGPKFGDRINKLKPDFVPNFEVPFGHEDNALKAVTNAPESPTTKYIPAPFRPNQFVQEPEPDFALPFNPNQDVQNTQQKPAPLHQGNNQAQIVHELEPNFEVPFGPNDNQNVQNTQQKPVPSHQGNNKGQLVAELEPEFSVSFGPNDNQNFQNTHQKPAVMSHQGNKKGQLVEELEPDFSVPFGANENYVFPNSQSMSVTTAAPGRPLASTLPSSVSTHNQGQFVADLEPDFAVPFGPNDKNTLHITQQKPVTTSAPGRPLSTTLPSSVSPSNEGQFVADLEPDFLVPFGPNDQDVIQNTQHRPTTTAAPGKPVSSTSNQGHLVADLEPDFAVPFGPNDKDTIHTTQQRPIHPSLIQSTNQGILVPDLEPDFSVPFGPNDNEQYLAPQQKPGSTSTTKPEAPAKKPLETELEPDFSVPFGPNDHIFPQQKPAVTSVPSITTTTHTSLITGNSQGQIVPEQEPDFAAPFAPNEVATSPPLQGQVTVTPESSTHTQNQINPDLEPDFSVPFGAGEQGQIPQKPHQKPEQLTPTRPVTEAVVSTENIIPDQQPELGLQFNPDHDISVTAVPATIQKPDQEPVKIEDQENSLPSGQNLKPQISEHGQNIPEFENVDAVTEIVKTNETGLLDFSQAERDEEGRLCLPRTEYIDSVVKEPVVECVHKSVEKCHYTYVTQFTPVKVFFYVMASGGLYSTIYITIYSPY